MRKIALPNRFRQRLGACALMFGVLGTVPDPTLAKTLPSSTPAVLTLNEAARLLRVSAVELKGYAAQNKVPARRIGTSWRFNRDALMSWLNGDWTIIASTLPPSQSDSMVLNQFNMEQVKATGTGLAQKAPSARSSKTSSADKTIGVAPKERAADDVFLRSQKVLLAPGEVTIEFGHFYSKQDSRELVQIDNGIGLTDVEEETLTTLLMGRVGVGNETEIFASTTPRNLDSDVYLGSTKLSEGGRLEIGDINLGVRRTLLHEGSGYPDII